MTETERKNIKICHIGGDLRQLSCLSALEEYGYVCNAYGFDTYRSDSDILSHALMGSDVAVLPTPVMRGDFLNMPLSSKKIAVSDLIPVLSASGIKLVIGGKLDCDMTEKLTSAGIRFFDLLKSEEFNHLNAIPTAEGAIALCMNHTPTTVDNGSFAVIGFGRIGKALSRRLKALCGNVTVCARKERDRAEASCEGYNAVSYKDLPDLGSNFDCVFNTVPDIVLTEPFLKELKKGSPIIELASKPGGVDLAAAIRHEVRIISAQSLPGRVAPVSAGKIMARCIHSLLDKEGGL